MLPSIIFIRHLCLKSYRGCPSPFHHIPLSAVTQDFMQFLEGRDAVLRFRAVFADPQPVRYTHTLDLYSQPMTHDPCTRALYIQLYSVSIVAYLLAGSTPPPRAHNGCLLRINYETITTNTMMSLRLRCPLHIRMETY